MKYGDYIFTFVVGLLFGICFSATIAGLAWIAKTNGSDKKPEVEYITDSNGVVRADKE